MVCAALEVLVPRGPRRYQAGGDAWAYRARRRQPVHPRPATPSPPSSPPPFPARATSLPLATLLQ